MSIAQLLYAHSALLEKSISHTANTVGARTLVCTVKKRKKLNKLYIQKTEAKKK